MLFGSLPKSVSSGTEACIRNASSNWAIRVWISGSSRSSASMPLSRLISSTLIRWRFRSMPGGLVM